MGNSGRYRRYAAECLEMASVVQDAQIRATLLLMAQAWFRLADQKTPGLQDAQDDHTRPDDHPR